MTNPGLSYSNEELLDHNYNIVYRKEKHTFLIVINNCMNIKHIYWRCIQSSFSQEYTVLSTILILNLVLTILILNLVLY